MGENLYMVTHSGEEVDAAAIAYDALMSWFAEISRFEGCVGYDGDQIDNFQNGGDC
jgi:hypothetical protein